MLKVRFFYKFYRFFVIFLESELTYLNAVKYSELQNIQTCQCRIPIQV